MFELVECFSLSGSPCEGSVLLGQVHERLGELSIVLDEALVEVGEAKEAMDAAYIGRDGPFRNCFHLGIVHINAITIDKHSEIFDFSLVE